jgi:hypothetical protein
MGLTSLKSFVSAVTLVAFTAMSLVLPGGQALAATRTMQFATGPYAVHTLNWENLGAMPAVSTSKTGDSSDGSGSFALVSANRAAQAVGITSDKMARIIDTFPSNMPIVFARYTTGANTLRIDIFMTRKANGKTMALHSEFTPQQGTLWGAQRTYQDPSTKAAVYEPGPNPFARFDAGDGLFHNINLTGAYTAVGHAMRLVGAPIGLLATSHYRLEQHVDSSGGVFVKKTTIKINGYTSPRWVIGMPSKLAPGGETGAICATDDATCPVYAIAPALVNFVQWQGGNMLQNEDLLYHHEESHSGLTIVTMMIIVGLITFAATSALTAALGPTAAGGARPVGVMSHLLTSGYPSLGIPGLGLQYGVGQIALADSIGYGLTTMATGNTMDLTDVQNAIYGHVDKGFDAPPSDVDKYSQALINATLPKMTGNVTNSLSATEGVLYGSCPPGSPLAGCPGSNGIIARDDAYIEHDEPQFVQDNGKPLISGVSNGITQ